VKAAKTIDELLVEYASNAIDHGVATHAGDYKRANRSHDEILRILQLLTERGERIRLADLLNHDDASVRCWAATHLLPFCEERARKALDDIVREGTWPASHSALVVLQEWDKGTLKVP
jgi:hypothetical protein